MAEPLVEMHGISKDFPGGRAEGAVRRTDAVRSGSFYIDGVGGLTGRPPLSETVVSITCYRDHGSPAGPRDVSAKVVTNRHNEAICA